MEYTITTWLVWKWGPFEGWGYLIELPQDATIDEYCRGTRGRAWSKKRAEKHAENKVRSICKQKQKIQSRIEMMKENERVIEC